MPNLNEAQNVSQSNSSSDIFRTSYGYGHHWRPGFYFPDTETMSKLNKSLPCGTSLETAVNPADHFTTTSAVTYDCKIPSKNLKSEQNPLPPHHWNVHYLNDFRSRYLSSGYHRPLSPSHQTTEMKDQYKNIDGPSELWRPLSMQPFELYNHNTDGPSKKVIASTVNSDLAGRIMYPKDKEVLRNLDPYLSTTMRDHRIWSPKELLGYAKKDAASFWDLEDYPKAHGFGVKNNPLPKASVPREKPPMRDQTQFPERTDHTRVRPITYHVPHTGLETLYQSDYSQPSSLLRKDDVVCPVETPFVLPDPSSTSAFVVQDMYKTEYSLYGQCQRTLQ